jgi:hypothetical protein
MAGQMTLLESMRDDLKRLRDVLSDGVNRLFADAKPITPPFASSAITEEPGAVFDAHVRAEFVERSVDATMATMTDAPYVTHVPVMTGGYGHDEVRQFYATWFIGRWPADVQITPISRTAGTRARHRRVHSQLHPRRRGAGTTAGHRADRPQGYPATRGGDGHRRPQSRLRAHLLGPSLAPRAGRRS